MVESLLSIVEKGKPAKVNQENPEIVPFTIVLD